MATNGTQAVDRAAALVALVARADEAVSFTQLTLQTGLARSTASRLLTALERSGLLGRDDKGAFVPGPLFVLYAARRGDDDDLARLAQPVMEALGTLTGETVNLGVSRSGDVLHIAQVDSRYLLASRDWVGVQVPPHLSALGKVLYAHHRLDLPTGRLTRLTDRGAATAAELRAELVSVRTRGFAVTIDELELGLTGIAAPIIVGTECVGALGVSGATARLGEQAKALGPVVARHAATLASTIIRHRKDGAA